MTEMGNTGMNETAPEFVIRLQDVALHPYALVDRLGVELDRYEVPPQSSLAYAQISMPDGGRDWYAVAWFLKQVGPRISTMIDELAIASATIDFATFMAGKAAVSLRIPARVASLAGENHIDVETSTYLSLSES